MGAGALSRDRSDIPGCLVTHAGAHSEITQHLRLMARVSNSASRARAFKAGALMPLLSGCVGVQSALAPFGVEAQTTFTITRAMSIAAAVITTAVVILAWRAV